jgi:hypothetical protein
VSREIQAQARMAATDSLFCPKTKDSVFRKAALSSDLHQRAQTSETLSSEAKSFLKLLASRLHTSVLSHAGDSMAVNLKL